MKPIFLLGVSLLLSLSLLSAGAGEREGGTKITKNEAEHIALGRYPGARVTAARLETVAGRLMWSIEIMPPKSQAVTAVAVDAMSGRIAAPKKGGH